MKEITLQEAQEIKRKAEQEYPAEPIYAAIAAAYKAGYQAAQQEKERG